MGGFPHKEGVEVPTRGGGSGHEAEWMLGTDWAKLKRKRLYVTLT